MVEAFVVGCSRSIASFSETHRRTLSRTFREQVGELSTERRQCISQVFLFDNHLLNAVAERRLFEFPEFLSACVNRRNVISSEVTGLTFETGRSTGKQYFGVISIARIEQ